MYGKPEGLGVALPPLTKNLEYVLAGRNWDPTRLA